jgi:hypothetical protein
VRTNPFQLAAAAVLASGLALAGDAPATDWSKHMGDLPFVVGMDAGRAEVKFTGRPAMLFFTSSTDQWCPKFAARTWKDKQVLADVAGYTPVLVDADTAPKELKDKYMVAILPGVVWTDFDESVVFSVIGDADLEMFRMGSDVAKDRCPDAHPPAEGLAALLELKKKLDEAAAAKDVKAQIAAIAEIRKVGAGAAVQKAAAAADARLTKEGEAEVARANGLITAKKKADAKKALEKLVADYGAEHPVAKKALELLDQLAGKTKPKK